MIVLRSPKGWTGPRVVDGLQVEGTWRSHQVPLAEVRSLHVEFVLTKPADRHHIVSVVSRLVRTAWHAVAPPEADKPEFREPWGKASDNQERSTP